MAWPGSVVTIAHSYTGLDGSASSGSVSFTLSGPLRNSGVTLPGGQPLVVTLTNGALSVSLPANDDPASIPAGTSYSVTERVTGASETEYPITVPATRNGLTIDLASLLPSDAGAGS